MTEPDVTLTDYTLAIECLVFSALVHRRPAPAVGLKGWFTLFFASVCAASLFGGTVHGFFLDADSTGHAILWPASLVAIGLTTWAAWAIGAGLLFSDRISRLCAAAAGIEFLVYSLLVIFITSNFKIAVINYSPAALFLLIAFLTAYRREKHGAYLFGVSGMVLTFAAALCQQLGLGLHPIYFNHNAVYHVIQAVALFLIFLAARRLATTQSVTGEDQC